MSGEDRTVTLRPIDPTPRTLTREFCQRCNRVSPVGFIAPKHIWRTVAGPRWEHSILCVLCFAALGDEKHIRWEEGIEFYPVSYATHHAFREGTEQ